MRAVPARPSRGLKSDFSDVLGRGAGSARSTSKSTIRMGGVYAAQPKIASESGRPDKSLIKGAANDQPSRLICSSVTTRSTFSVLLLMR